MSVDSDRALKQINDIVDGLFVHLSLEHRLDFIEDVIDELGKRHEEIEDTIESSEEAEDD